MSALGQNRTWRYRTTRRKLGRLLITGHAHRPPRLEFGQLAFETTDTRMHQVEVSRMYRLIDFTQNSPGPGQERFTYSMGLNGMTHDTLSFLRVYAPNSV